MKCPNCGREKHFGVVCESCGKSLIDSITQNDYLKYLIEWGSDKDKFLRYLNNDKYAFSFRILFMNIECEAENDSKLSQRFDEFKKAMYVDGNSFDAESYAVAYLKNQGEAFGEFKKYLSEVTKKKIESVRSRSNIFGYYIRLINGIKIKYTELKRNIDANSIDTRVKDLYSEVVVNVNEILEKICTNKIFRSNTNRFRRFYSKDYPTIHNEYCEYLKALNEAVLSTHSETVATILVEVK